MLKTIFKIILLTTVALSACIRIPDEHFIVSQRGGISTVQDDCDCDISRFENTLEIKIMVTTQRNLRF